LIEEYFDVFPVRKTLVDDTIRVIIPSVRPGRAIQSSPPSSQVTPEAAGPATYSKLCGTLNGWAQKMGLGSPCKGAREFSTLGIGVLFSKRTGMARRRQGRLDTTWADLLSALDHLREINLTKAQDH